MPLDVHVRILTEMLAGLHYAHTLIDFDGTPLHVVHRDVSPQNVFITYDGQIKVVDFGIAKAATREVETLAGTLKGKIGYMSPEQCRGLAVDARRCETNFRRAVVVDTAAADHGVNVVAVALRIGQTLECYNSGAASEHCARRFGVEGSASAVR